jgi:hypothetical protein
MVGTSCKNVLTLFVSLSNLYNHIEWLNGCGATSLCGVVGTISLEIALTVKTTVLHSVPKSWILFEREFLVIPNSVSPEGVGLLLGSRNNQPGFPPLDPASNFTRFLHSSIE